MGSKKGSAKAKRLAEFRASLESFDSGVDDAFAREAGRKQRRAEEQRQLCAKRPANQRIDTAVKAMRRLLLLRVLHMVRPDYMRIVVRIAMDGI